MCDFYSWIEYRYRDNGSRKVLRLGLTDDEIIAKYGDRPNFEMRDHIGHSTIIDYYTNSTDPYILQALRYGTHREWPKDHIPKQFHALINSGKMDKMAKAGNGNIIRRVTASGLLYDIGTKPPKLIRHKRFAGIDPSEVKVGDYVVVGWHKNNDNWAERSMAPMVGLALRVKKVPSRDDYADGVYCANIRGCGAMDYFWHLNVARKATEAETIAAKKRDGIA